MTKLSRKALETKVISAISGLDDEKLIEIATNMFGNDIKEQCSWFTADEDTSSVNEQTIEAWLAAGKGQYTTSQLTEAFKRVASPKHWKCDIDAVVPADMQEILRYAIPWHVGGGDIEFIKQPDGMIHVLASGYWSNGMDG
jgi:hypothetical protein